MTRARHGTARYQPPGHWRHPKFMATDNNEKVPRVGKLPLGSYSANFEWKGLIQFHQQHFSFNHGPDTAITTPWMAQDYCQLRITLQSLHRLICNAQNVSASALGLGPVWILLKVDPPSQTQPDVISRQPVDSRKVGFSKRCLCTVRNLDLLFEMYAELDSIFCSFLFIWGAGFCSRSNAYPTELHSRLK